MYPKIAPDIELRETISDPEQPERVVGFTGRNKKMGRDAVVMKHDESTDSFDRRVEVPTTVHGLLADGADLVVLGDHDVHVMRGTYYTENYTETNTPELSYIPLSDPQFREFSRSKIEVGN